MTNPSLSEALVYAIDDEPDNLDLLRRTLAPICRVQTFSDAASALAAARGEPPDLVLLDYRMPGQNGAQLLEGLRQAGVDCAAVFVTAYPEATDVQRLVDSSDVLWIVPKPLNPEQLCSQVYMALSLSRIRTRVKSLEKKST